MARNKAHKQRFASKRAVSGLAKGRTIPTKKESVKALHPLEAKERSRQSLAALRDKKRANALQQKRIGKISGLPRAVGVLPANESANTDLVIRGLCFSLGSEVRDTCLPFTASSKEKKASFTFMSERNGNLQSCVDIGKVADFLVLALDVSRSVQEMIRNVQESMEVEDCDDVGSVVATTWYGDIGLCITAFTRELIAALNAQGVPSVAVVLQNLDTFTEKQRHKVIKVHQRYFLSVLPETTKVFTVIDQGDYDPVLRHLHVAKLRSLAWRDQHPYLIVEEGYFDDDAQKLVVGGYLRGMALSAEQLIHLTNHGTFQIENICRGDPRGDEAQVIDSCEKAHRESLDYVQVNATLDDADGPTEEDIAYHKSIGFKKVKVPEGVSDYQAAWYEFEGSDINSETDIGESVPGDDEYAASDHFSQGTLRTTVDFLKVEDVIRLERMNDDERAAEIQRLKEESEEDAWNPDIVDTPFNLPARQRFMKYRGLKSFQTGKWDAAENLPPHYAYIYKLQGITRIREAALAKCASGSVATEQFVYITLVDVPSKVWRSAVEGGCIIASGQLEHEQKWSVLHFRIQRSSDCDEPIKSKIPMLAHIGFRKFYVSPIFSDITTSDRTKFARFFHPNEKFCMASFFGPISYQPCPILLFEVPSLEEQNEDNSLHLACFGGALPPNPDLLVLKRAVLTGRVATIHKKQIVVKYMFFNDEDVQWFQSVDLRTRLGRRGKIIKAVGTRGLFKASLNDQVMQHDLVCMDLYKRVFPKWTTLPFCISDVPKVVAEE
ncbi:pre-rrna-processing protein tsr1 like protein [Trypanosoma brucei equiperdum]|uniref:Pre-rrna-processing protein tsr1 like protein n=1 Tax=Trypanosoma brucei equiperdum TaxID=630700 RepID=A0A3L6L3A3_9TRYP|nr:pre-rrna-processing protein tsr1 like protein [Trypanosoma brucei equiperdum]